MEVDGKCADGVLGQFADEHKTYVAVIAHKGASVIDRLLEKTQKIPDRVLFVCFCEDRGLLWAYSRKPVPYNWCATSQSIQKENRWPL